MSTTSFDIQLIIKILVLNSCRKETTVYFSVVIDRESFSPVIVRTMCDVWRTIKSAIFVTDEHNVVSLWSVEGPTNLVDV